MMGEAHEGGSVRRTLPRDVSRGDIAEALRELAEVSDFSTAEWIRADFWEAGATEPVTRIRAEDVGIMPRET
jgi:hypothetical protein